MTAYEILYGKDLTDDTITDRAIRAHFCSDSSLIQGGNFYLPTEIVDGVQRYRIETVEYDPVQEVNTINISQDWYIRENGRFVVGGHK